MEEIRHFITVDRCRSGQRGVFCQGDGVAPTRDEPWTWEEMDAFLGIFGIILDPKSLELTDVQLSEYGHFQPLAEYSHVWGIALKREDVPPPEIES